MGIILVKFFINGAETYVIIDDYLPCKEDGRLLSTSCSIGNISEPWVPLLEKAWAKLNGSYAAIAKCDFALTYTHLFGLPARNIFHENVMVSDDSKE